MVAEIVKHFPEAMSFRDAIRALAIADSANFEIASMP